MKFYNRQTELAQLEKIGQRAKEGAQLTFVVGRRRIGKTSLLLKAYDDPATLYFFVAKKIIYLEMDSFFFIKLKTIYPNKKNTAKINIEFRNELDIEPTKPKIKVPNTIAIFSVTSKKLK